MNPKNPTGSFRKILPLKIPELTREEKINKAVTEIPLPAAFGDGQSVLLGGLEYQSGREIITPNLLEILETFFVKKGKEIPNEIFLINAANRAESFETFLANKRAGNNREFLAQNGLFTRNSGTSTGFINFAELVSNSDKWGYFGGHTPCAKATFTVIFGEQEIKVTVLNIFINDGNREYDTLRPDYNHDIQQLIDLYELTNAFINTGFRRGAAVQFYCRQGQNRSAMFLSAWLISRGVPFGHLQYERAYGLMGELSHVDARDSPSSTVTVASLLSLRARNLYGIPLVPSNSYFIDALRAHELFKISSPEAESPPRITRSVESNPLITPAVAIPLAITRMQAFLMLTPVVRVQEKERPAAAAAAVSCLK